MMCKRPRGLFITGTDTGVGKTYVAATNRRELAARSGPPVLAEVAWQSARFDAGVDWFALAKEKGVAYNRPCVKPLCNGFSESRQFGESFATIRAPGEAESGSAEPFDFPKLGDDQQSRVQANAVDFLQHFHLREALGDLRQQGAFTRRL